MLTSLQEVVKPKAIVIIASKNLLLLQEITMKVLITAYNTWEIISVIQTVLSPLV